MPPCFASAFPAHYLGIPSSPHLLKILLSLQGPALVFPSSSDPPDCLPHSPAGGLVPIWGICALANTSVRGLFL